MPGIGIGRGISGGTGGTSGSGSSFDPSPLVETAAQGIATGVITGALDTTGANLLVVAVTEFENTADAIISDSKGNVWTLCAAIAITGAQNLRLFYSIPTTVGVGHTFQAAGAGTYPSICVQAWKTSGAATFDHANALSFEGVTSNPHPGEVSPTANGSLLITALGHGALITTAIEPGFTETSEAGFISGSCFGTALAYKVQNPAIPIDPIWTCNGPAAYCCAIVVFKP